MTVLTYPQPVRTNWFANLRRELRQRRKAFRDYRELMVAEPRLLSDMGLSRDEVRAHYAAARRRLFFVF